MTNNCPLCGSEISEVPFTILKERGMVAVNGSAVILPDLEAKCLSVLSEHFPRVVSTEKMMSELYWDRGEEPEPKIVDVLVCKIRAKIKPLGVSIETHWGRGYSISAKAQIIEEIE